MSPEINNTKLQEALELLNEAAKDKKEELLSLVGNKHEHIKEIFTDSMEKSLEKIKEKAAALHHLEEEAKKKVKESWQTFDTSVHHSPWPYIGGAALCGFLIGLWSNHHRGR